MTVIILAKNFEQLKKAYDSTGLPTYSSTKVNILKKLILLSTNYKELEELRTSVIGLKKYYNNGTKIDYENKANIKEVMGLFIQKEKQFNFFKTKEEQRAELKYFTTPETKKIVDNENNFQKDKAQKENQLKNECIIGGLCNGKRKRDFNLKDIDIIVRLFFEENSVIFKSFYLKRIKSIDVSFSVLVKIYNNESYKSVAFKKTILDKMIDEAESLDELIYCYNLINTRYKRSEKIALKIKQAIKTKEEWIMVRNFVKKNKKLWKELFGKSNNKHV